MANRTEPAARSIRGTNPQNLVEKILRSKIYQNTYWKEQCFGLTAETLVDKAMELDHLGGTYGGNRKPTPFMCLVMKMLQIQPEKEIVIEFIKNEDYKYVRVLGAFYLRLTGTDVDVYRYLEPLYNDYRELRRKLADGQFTLTHVDEVIDELLTKDYSCDIALPRVKRRLWNPMEDLRNPMLKFFSDQELCYADIVPSAQVRARIEVSVLNFLKNLNASNPAISDLPLIQRKFCNSRVNHSLMADLSCVFLSHSISSRSLMRPNAAKAFVRVWKVMELCYQILLQEKRVTQRELYYKLLCDSPHLFPSQTDVNRTIQDVVALLRCSRYSLGIMASSRGLIAGRLTFQEPGKEVVDCSVCGSSGHAIPGDVNLLENLILDTDARYIIIVEKHAIFQRLAEDQFFNQIPSILVTAKGYPDMATRVLLHRIHQTFPDLPILALVDWNPAGLAILCTFKFGSVTMGLEAYRYACNVKWLGLRGHDLEMLPDESLIPLKPKDLQIAQSLMSSGILQGNYRDEVALMVQSGRRAEIEALYFHGYDYLGKYIAKKIVQSDYI